jgi:hypothetical protein
MFLKRSGFHPDGRISPLFTAENLPISIISCDRAWQRKKRAVNRHAAPAGLTSLKIKGEHLISEFSPGARMSLKPASGFINKAVTL